VFRLVILFLDGTFSQHILKNQQTLVSDTITSLQAPLDEPTHTVAPVQEVNEMVNDVVHQKLGNSEIFQDLNVLEYLYTKNKNPKLLQPLVEKFIQYYQFDKANQYLALLVQNEGEYSKLNLDPHQVVYTLFHDSNVGLDSATALNDVFTLVQDYRARNLFTHGDGLFYQGLKALRIYDYSGATNLFSQITDPRYKDFKSSYESALANFVKIKNPPSYYRDGLVSLTLLKN